MHMGEAGRGMKWWSGKLGMHGAVDERAGRQ